MSIQDRSVGHAEIVERPVGPYLENSQKSVWKKLGEERTSPRYLGENAAEYRGSVNVEPCWTFKIVPQKIMTWQGFGWHKRYFNEELHSPDGAHDGYAIS